MNENIAIDQRPTSGLNRSVAIWAASATVVALLASGMLIGKILWGADDVQVMSAEAPTSTQPGVAEVEDKYLVPDWLSGAPMEWRTQVGGSREGYAILFDYQKRRLLVDHCEHPGYFDVDANLPRPNVHHSCERALTAELIEFGDQGVVALRKDGSPVEITTKPVDSNGRALLGIQFDEHSMTLIPGQTNDLINEIVALPELVQEYQYYFEYQQQKMKQRRAESLAKGKSGVPMFEVPPDVLKANEAVREEDHKASLIQ